MASAPPRLMNPTHAVAGSPAPPLLPLGFRRPSSHLPSLLPRRAARSAVVFVARAASSDSGKTECVRNGGLYGARVSRSKQLPSMTMLCNSAVASRSSAGQTQTIARPISTIPNAPIGLIARSPKLDDGGTGFPPRNEGGGGGGGGGGGSASSGGFYLFAFLVFMNYLKELESEKLDGGRSD